MTWINVWTTRDATQLAEQRYVINRLLRSDILEDDIKESLRATAYVLAMVQDGMEATK